MGGCVRRTVMQGRAGWVGVGLLEGRQFAGWLFRGDLLLLPPVFFFFFVRCSTEAMGTS